MERVANQEWIKEMRKGNGLGGGRAKGMESALWVMQGTRERFRFCSWAASLCLPEELAE